MYLKNQGFKTLFHKKSRPICNQVFRQFFIIIMSFMNHKNCSNDFLDLSKKDTDLVLKHVGYFKNDLNLSMQLSRKVYVGLYLST